MVAPTGRENGTLVLIETLWNVNSENVEVPARISNPY